MKIKVIKEFKTEIFEVSELQEDIKPPSYAEPFFVVAESRQDMSVSFQFNSRKNVFRKSGKPKYFDNCLSNAQKFESYSHAIAAANKFRTNEFSSGQKFYVVGIEQARIIQIQNEIDSKKFRKAIEK